jgi:hypothetical protein
MPNYPLLVEVGRGQRLALIYPFAVASPLPPSLGLAEKRESPDDGLDSELK